MLARNVFDAYRAHVPEGARILAVTEEVVYRTRARYGAVAYVNRELTTVGAVAVVKGEAVAAVTCPVSFGADRDALSALHARMSQ